MNSLLMYGNLCFYRDVRMSVLKSILVGLLICVSLAAKAGPIFLITASPTSITTSPGQTTSIIFTVQNLASLTMQKMKYYAPALTTIVAGGTCGSTLAAHASCTVNTTFTAPQQTGQILLGPFTVCAQNGSICSTQNVSQRVRVTVTATASLIAYIANGNSNTVSICPVLSSGLLNTCTTFSDPSFFEPTDIILNSQNTIAYVADRGVGISVCPVNANGSLSTCSLTSADISATGLRLHIVNGQNYIYFTFDAFVYQCVINNDGSIGSCNTLTDRNFGLNAGRVTFSSNGSFAYVGSVSGLNICPVNQTTGEFGGDCASFMNGGVFVNAIRGLDINSDGTFLYVATYDGTSTVYICPISDGGATIGPSCTSTTGDSTFNFSDNFVTNIFMTNLNGYAYAPNGGGTTVSVCPVANSGASFGTCATSTDASFNEPDSVWIATFH